jgi:hypothetical protein
MPPLSRKRQQHSAWPIFAACSQTSSLRVVDAENRALVDLGFALGRASPTACPAFTREEFRMVSRIYDEGLRSSNRVVEGMIA